MLPPGTPISHGENVELKAALQYRADLINTAWSLFAGFTGNRHKTGVY
jgi:hypothetical protein